VSVIAFAEIGEAVEPTAVRSFAEPPPGDSRRLEQHWARVGLERSSAVPDSPGALFSYSLFATGTELHERIRQLHIEYFEKVRKIGQNRAPQTAWCC
jgi:hypothetical protein